MGGFSGSNKNSSWASTPEEREYFKSQIPMIMQNSMANIQKAYQNTDNRIGSIQSMGYNQGLMNMQKYMNSGTPGAVNSGGTQALMAIAPEMMAMQQQADQAKLAAQLGVDANTLAAYQQLAALSGGSKSKQTEGWGSALGKGLGLAASFMIPGGGALASLGGLSSLFGKNQYGNPGNPGYKG